jgi:hypothetical protein
MAKISLGASDQKPGQENNEASSEALKPLRFSYHRTAFDVDISELDETPWREHHTDISDYFNYGFSETTWNVCFLLFVFVTFLLVVLCKAT